MRRVIGLLLLLTRRPGQASLFGVLLAPLGLLLFEPEHFIMQRSMPLGIRQRAESAQPSPHVDLPEAMIGDWAGEAAIVVDWVTKRTLAVRLEIGHDGSVTGRVGDATLRAGSIRRNRGALGRWLRVKTDYLVVGDLDGEIVAAEEVRRAAVRLPLDWTGDSFRGGLHTSGSKAGGKEGMMLSATRLLLRRAAAPSAPGKPDQESVERRQTSGSVPLP